MTFTRWTAAFLLVWGSGTSRLAAAAPPAESATPTAGSPAASSTPITAAPESLTAAAFRSFGEVIAIPEGQKPTLDAGAVVYWGGLAKARFAEEVEFGMLQVAARPAEVAELKRHVRSPAFLASLTGEWVLVVAPPTLASRPLLAGRVRAFVVKAGQAVLLKKGAWYADPFPKGDSGLFLVAFRDGTARKDSKARSFKGKETVRIQ